MEVYGKYDITKEHIQLQNYHAEMAIQELKKLGKSEMMFYKSHKNIIVYVHFQLEQ